MNIAETASTKEDLLQYLLKKGPSSAVELAEAMHISPQAIRRHLKDLAQEGLIEYEAVQQKMGRPQYRYKLSRQGRDRFGHSYGEFAVSFLDTLSETVGKEQVSQILQKQWERKAQEYRLKVGDGSLLERMTRLVNLRLQEGYMAELHKVREGEKYILAEHHCAISEVAESYPRVCDHELQMFATVLPDCTIERTHWLNNGEHRCGYLIKSTRNEV